MSQESFPSRVRVVEVGPRDGLQNEPTPVPVEARIALIEALADSGLTRIECGSFVSPRWVPQMAGTEDVFAKLNRISGVRYSALVPNIQGIAKAAECKADEVAVFVSASEAFSRANLNCSIEESLRRSEEVVRAACKLDIPVRGYISCVMGCPFAGEVLATDVVSLTEALLRMGCYEISLGDTIGVGTPLQVQHTLDEVGRRVPVEKLAVHFHDTWGQALANVFAALELGIAVVDSAVAGLGGCPYAPGASGNLATEDLLYMLNGMQIETGIDIERVAAAGSSIGKVIGKQANSKVAKAMQSSKS